MQNEDSPLSDAYYLQLVQSILLTGINGVPNLKFRSAEQLAADYLNNRKYKDDRERVAALIHWETSKNFSTGFISGVGGVITLPVAIPAALSASWVIQARLAASIAHLYGHNLSESRIQTMTLLCMVGDGGKEVLKRAGLSLGKELAEQAIGKVSSEMLLAINQQVGFRLLVRAGEAGVINLTSLVPIAGGIVGGTIDAVACRAVGYTANNVFANTRMTLETLDFEIIEDLHLAAQTLDAQISSAEEKGTFKARIASSIKGIKSPTPQLAADAVQRILQMKKPRER